MPTIIEKQPPVLGMVRNPMEFRLQNIDQWGTAAYLICNLYVETESTSGSFELVEEMEAERDQYGAATFDVSKTLEAQLAYFFSNSRSSALLRCPHLCKRYYIEYGYRTGPEVLLADIYGAGTPGTANWQEMDRPFQAGKPYHLLLNTSDMALAQQVAFRHTNYFGAEYIHAPQEFVPYKDKIYCVFLPPDQSVTYEFIELSFQEIRVPAELQVLVYSNFALMEKSEEKYALLGGWLHTHYPSRNTLLPGNRQLLTPQPAVQQAVNGQLQHFYYLPQADEALTTRVRCLWKDGTVAHTDFAQGNVQRLVAYRFGLQLRDEQLPGYAPGKQFEQVEVAQNGVVLATFLRREVNTDYLQEVYYTNSLGGVDTLCCTGFGSDQLDVERESAEIYLPEDYRADQAALVNFSATGRIKQTLATGPLTKEEMQAHLGILLSREIRLKVGELAAPAVLTTKGATRQKDGNHLHAFEFELQHAYPYNEIHPVEGEAAEAIPGEDSLLILNNSYLKVIS